MEDGGVMTVEEAWARVQEKREWVPAWRTWSRQVVKPGGQGNRLDFALVPPLVVEEEEERAIGGREEWEEEELEAFLQQCELEAGLIEEVDAEEVRRRSDSWRVWEEEATMAGIECPTIEEQGPQGGAWRGQAAAEEAEEALPPPREQRRTARGEDGGRRIRQRWRPIRIERAEGEPCVEEAVEPPMEGGRAVDAVPVQARPARTSTVRPRGRRQRGGPAELFEVDVITFNGSGSPQTVAALGALKEERKRVAAVLVQEHLARGDAVADLQHAARQAAFKLAPCEAAQGKGGGPSAGVGIAVPLHRGWGGDPGTVLGPLSGDLAWPPGGSLDPGWSQGRHVLLLRLPLDKRGDVPSQCGACGSGVVGSLGVRRSMGDRGGLERHPEGAQREGGKAT